MASRDYDVAILGGGLAGLSLAVRLAASPHIRTLVVEPRRAYRRDRTWSYWRVHDHPFAAAVATRWERWDVRRPGPDGGVRSAIRTSRTYPYETIPADALYRLALKLIAAAPHVELRLGAAAGRVDEDADGVAIELPDGTVRAAFVFDSRPPSGGADYAQRFLGQEIVADRPVFDPDRVMLMDFTVPQEPGSVHFLYVLPSSPVTALVEDTWFAPMSASLPDSRETIRAYLGSRYGLGDYDVAFEEEAAIPMDAGLTAPRRSGRVIPIGTPGGAIKPSSGYGFMAIQRGAGEIAADLAAGRPPRPARARGAVAEWLDAVFLHALRTRPETAPGLFYSLFAGCAPDPLIRFLNDVGGPLDAARTMAALPLLPMMATAGEYLAGARGGGRGGGGGLGGLSSGAPSPTRGMAG